MIDNKAYVERCRKIATEWKTRYALGGWGQLATDANKAMFINNYSYNSSVANVYDNNGNTVKSDRKQVILDTPSDYHFFDCNCWNKAMLDMDNNLKIHYATPCPDVTIVQMLSDCTDVSTDFSSVMPGELIVYESKHHCGVYLGDGMTAECVPDWNDGVQIRSLDNRWKYHGKMTKYIDYIYSDSSSVDKDAIIKHLNSIRSEVDEIEALLLNL